MFVSQAKSIGRTALARISVPGRIGIVHTIFPDAVNILTPDKHLVSVVNRRVGNGPINLVADFAPGKTMTSIGVAEGDSFVRRGGALVVPDRVVISITQASTYRPNQRFGDAVRRAGEIRNNLVTMLRYSQANGRSAVAVYLMKHLQGRVGDRLERPGRPRRGSPRSRSWLKGEARVGRMALPHVANLLAAIQERNYQQVRASATHLIGLGPGLTPSADDILAGLMVSLRLADDNHIVERAFVTRVNEEIMSRVPNRTTRLSEEFLVHAAVGEANEPVMRLLERILTAGPGQVRNATRRLLAVGASSGTEIALGIWLGLQIALHDPVARGGAA